MKKRLKKKLYSEILYSYPSGINGVEVKLGMNTDNPKFPYVKIKRSMFNEGLIEKERLYRDIPTKTFYSQLEGIINEMK